MALRMVALNRASDGRRFARKVKSRLVPLHEHIISQGFIDFVHRMGDGPLFYSARTKGAVKGDPLKPVRSPSQT